MSVAVVVPYAPSDPWRERAWSFVQRHYAVHHPTWQVVTGTCGGEWSKGLAVADALTKTDADVLVIADADVWVAHEALNDSVRALETSAWAVPHLLVKRLSQAATVAFYDGHWTEDFDRRPYRGVVGGGMVVLGRRTYEDCPLDPRFTGWGGEDVSWGWMLDRLHGPPVRGAADLWHLYHPTAKPPRLSVGRHGKLVNRYRHASRHPEVRDALIAEAREATWSARPSTGYAATPAEPTTTATP